MSKTFPDIKSVVAKLITDKPVRKTAYQVKGVFMRQYPDEPIIPMLDGSCRNKFLYPRIQVKILNEQIYIIGIHEGVDAILCATKQFSNLDFGNITFEIQDCDIESLSGQFVPTDRLLRYRFITPWVALNHMTGAKYRSLHNKEKLSYLNKLLGQNLIFLAKEVGIKIEEDVFANVKVASLFPKPVDENKWGAFKGEFKTNFILPNYIGVGNGITRGFGTIYGMFNPDSFVFNEDELKKEFKTQRSLKITEAEDIESISVEDVPKSKRKINPYRSDKANKYRKKRSKKRTSFRTKKAYRNKKHPQATNNHSEENKKRPKSGNFFPEEDDIKDDQRFNTEKHHKKQHKF